MREVYRAAVKFMTEGEEDDIREGFSHSSIIVEMVHKEHKKIPEDYEKGFTTTDGEFVTREVANGIAKAAAQGHNTTYGKLFSYNVTRWGTKE